MQNVHAKEFTHAHDRMFDPKIDFTQISPNSYKGTKFPDVFLSIICFSKGDVSQLQIKFKDLNQKLIHVIEDSNVLKITNLLNKLLSCLPSKCLFLSSLFCLSFYLDPIWKIYSSILLCMPFMVLTKHFGYFLFILSLFLLFFMCSCSSCPSSHVLTCVDSIFYLVYCLLFLMITKGGKSW